MPRDSIWEETSEKASERRHLGGDIWEEKSEERHLRGLWKELWERLWEGSGMALGRLWGSSGRGCWWMWRLWRLHRWLR